MARTLGKDPNTARQKQGQAMSAAGKTVAGILRGETAKRNANRAVSAQKRGQTISTIGKIVAGGASKRRKSGY